MKNLSEVLKSTTSITEVAKTLECSRPTLYRYIRAYDEGKFDQIPSEVKLYFDALLTEGVSRAESEAYLLSLKIKRENVQKKLDVTQDQIRMLSQEILMSKVALSRDPDNPSMMNELEKRECQLMRLKAVLCEYEKESHDLEMDLCKTAVSVEKAVKESREYGPDWIDAEIRHVCSGTNDNFVIIYEKPDSDSEVYVELYARIAGNDEYMGRYVPEQGKNFVQITGLPNTLSYSYRIVLFDDDGKHCTEYMKLNTR